MAENANCTVYVGNLDEKVSDRVLYDILIQAGRVVDLYIPRDRETEKPKGFAFAQYETQDIAQYAVKLFSGLVTLYNRMLKFAISGQDKPSMNSPSLKSSLKPRPQPVAYDDMGVSPNSMTLSTSCRFSEHQSQVHVNSGLSVHQPNGYRSNYDNYNYEHSNGYRANYDNNYEHSNGYRSHYDNNYEHSNGYRSHYNNYNYDYSGRVFGAAFDNITRSRFGRYDDTRDLTSYYASY